MRLFSLKEAVFPMQPKVALLLFYGVLTLLAVGWLVTGAEWNSVLFFILFLSSFLFNAYCGYLEFKRDNTRI